MNGRSIVNIRFKCNVSTVDENVESWTVDGKMIHFDVKQVLRVTLMKETLYVNVTKYWFTIPILLAYFYNAKLEKIIRVLSLIVNTSDFALPVAGNFVG